MSCCSSGEVLSDQLRALRKDKGLIDHEEKTFTRLAAIDMTNVQKRDALNYGGSEIIQFFRNSGRFKAGDRIKAAEVLPHLAELKPAHFAVYGLGIAARQLWKSFHNCPYRRSVVMERRRRAEPSPPGFSTLIALHNHGPGSRATQRPGASGQPSNPSRRGLAGLEPEPLSIESVLGAVMSLRLPLRGRPERWPRYGKSFPGSMSRKGRSRRDLRSPWSSLLCITTDFL